MRQRLLGSGGTMADKQKANRKKREKIKKASRKANRRKLVSITVTPEPVKTDRS